MGEKLNKGTIELGKSIKFCEVARKRTGRCDSCDNKDTEIDSCVILANRAEFGDSHFHVCFECIQGYVPSERYCKENEWVDV